MRLFKFVLIAAFTLPSAASFAVQTAKKPGIVPQGSQKAATPATPATSAKPAGKTFTAAEGDVEFHAVGRPAMLKIVGKANAPKGDLNADGAGSLTGKLVLPLAALDTGMNLRNEHMKDKYLEVAKHPDAELTLDPVNIAELAGSGDFEKENMPFTGKLKLHGEEKPVAGEADISRFSGKLGVKADFTIKTSDFKIDTPKYMGITVAEDVKVAVNFSATEKN